MTIEPRAGFRQPRRHRIIDRVAAILDVVARTPAGLSLTELAAASDAPMSSTQALVNGLVATGFLEEKHARTYVLGTAPYLLNLLAGRRLVSRVSHEALDDLRRESGLTAVLAVNVGDDVFYVDHSSDDRQYDDRSETFIRSSLIYSSTGLVLLAGMEKAEAWSYIGSLPESDSWRVERYLAALPELKRTGISSAPGVSPQGDGVAIAVKEGETTIASVGLIGASAMIAASAPELSAILAAHASRWSD